jgi:hypothetical protein
LARDKDNVGVLLAKPRALILQHNDSEILRRHSVINAACVSLHFNFRLKFANRLNSVWKRIGGSGDLGQVQLSE